MYYANMNCISFVFLTVVTALAFGLEWIPGGISPVTNDATSETQAIVDSVKSAAENQLNANFGTFEAISYRTQVVAGTMYFVKVKTGEGQYIHLKIWNKLDDTNELQDVQSGKERDDSIEYF